MPEARSAEFPYAIEFYQDPTTGRQDEEIALARKRLREHRLRTGS